MRMKISKNKKPPFYEVKMVYSISNIFWLFYKLTCALYRYTVMITKLFKYYFKLKVFRTWTKDRIWQHYPYWNMLHLSIVWRVRYWWVRKWEGSSRSWPLFRNEIWFIDLFLWFCSWCRCRWLDLASSDRSCDVCEGFAQWSHVKFPLIIP